MRGCAVALLAAQLEQRQRVSRKSSTPLPSSSVSADITPFFNDDAASLKTRQAALLAVESIARDHAATFPDAFMRALPYAVCSVAMSTSSGAGAAEGALLLVSTLISQLSRRLVPQLPH